MNKKTKKDAGPGKAIAIASAVAVVIVIVILLLLRSCGAPANDPGGIEFDPSATEGGWDEADTDEIIAGLNEKVEAGMINISMNTSPVFADGTSKGSLMIVNEEVNNYPQVVEISRDDTGELIYKSGAIPVGSKIESAKLSVDLDPVHTNAQRCSTTLTPTPGTTSAAPGP